ncbi:unnamed protein product, partial [Ectocarpus sp. 12 AP-2014]
QQNQPLGRCYDYFRILVHKTPLPSVTVSRSDSSSRQSTLSSSHSFPAEIMVTIELTPAHGFPMAVAICSAFVTTWAGVGVGMARKKYGIKYPQMYAEQSDANAVVFNCYQRAHQNVLENYPSFLLLLGLAA